MTNIEWHALQEKLDLYTALEKSANSAKRLCLLIDNAIARINDADRSEKSETVQIKICGLADQELEFDAAYLIKLKELLVSYAADVRKRQEDL